MRERREGLSEYGMGGIPKLNPVGNQSGWSRVKTAKDRDSGRGIFLHFGGNTLQTLAWIFFSASQLDKEAGRDVRASLGQ